MGDTDSIQSPRRIVSLVPSDTFNVAALGARSRLVGRTRYCVEPRGLDEVATVGGTKQVRVDKVLALRPDLVLANREENSRDDVLALVDAGVEVMLTFPRTVSEGLDSLVAIAHRLGVAWEGKASALLRTARTLQARLSRPVHAPGASCFVPIWKKPWMTVNDDTYVGDVLRVLGLRNVFGGLPSQGVDGRDTRYPVVELDDVVAMQPEVVLLPDEPYPFSDRHARQMSELPIPAARSGRIHRVSGRDLCWPGAWAIDGIGRLADRISR